MSIRKRKRQVSKVTWFNRVTTDPEFGTPTLTMERSLHEEAWRTKHAQRTEDKYERQSMRNFRRHGKWWKWRPYGTLSPVTYWKRTKKRLADERKALAQATSV